jgi:hypothetical protein
VRIESWLEHLAPVRSWGILPQEFTYTHGLLANALDHTGREGRMIIREVFDLIERCGHEPAMQIRYDHRAYTTPDFNFRITFDSDLVCKWVSKEWES